MASLSQDGPKRWRIQFQCVAGTGTRRQIRIFGLTKKQAESHVARIESIISTRLQGANLDDVDAAWLGKLPDSFHTRLAKAGLVEPRDLVEPNEEPLIVVTLGELLADYSRDGRTAKGRPASKRTIIKWRASITYLQKYFGHDRDIATITHDDAYQFWRHMDAQRIKKTKTNKKGIQLAENTIRKHISNAKVFFNGAVRRGLIAINPFERLVSSNLKARDRDFEVTRMVTEKILTECPDSEWRLMVALWRYAGLRKMEIFGLTWSDVLWDQGRMRIHSSKTAHHDGKDVRYVPLRDIRPYLDTLYFDPGTVDGPIINRFASSNTNLDKPFRAILRRAGLKPWPKLFHNMRASCETEWLNEGIPAHVVAGWMGHSVQVQRQSYAQITDGHFEKFNTSEPMAEPIAQSGSECGSDDAGNGENSPENVSHNMSHQPLKRRKPRKTLSFRGSRVAVEGLEPPTRGL